MTKQFPNISVLYRVTLVSGKSLSTSLHKRTITITDRANFIPARNRFPRLENDLDQKFRYTTDLLIFVQSFLVLIAPRLLENILTKLKQFRGNGKQTYIYLATSLGRSLSPEARDFAVHTYRYLHRKVSNTKSLTSKRKK